MCVRVRYALFNILQVGVKHHARPSYAFFSMLRGRNHARVLAAASAYSTRIV